MEDTTVQRQHWLWIAAALALVCIAVVFLLVKRAGSPDGSQQPDLTQRSFDGSSQKLERTVVVPTLDTPFDEGVSAIWCSSFQVAWNHLKTDVVKGAVQVRNAEAISDRLNRAEQSEEDLASDDYYAAAGLVANGIVERIRTDMSRRFPDVLQPLTDTPHGTAAIAYAYLTASIKFTVPFFENDEALHFTDSTGKPHAVSSFGIRKKDSDAYRRLREQVQVLFCDEQVWETGIAKEFALDLFKESSPSLLVVARFARKATLEEMFEYCESRTKGPPRDRMEHRFGPMDTLLVPNMHWRIEHRFHELQGKDKPLLNPTLRGQYIDTALQTIQFKLDRSGADLASEAKVYSKGGARYFECNKPFMIYMKKRTAKHPFLVMWVDNAELLSKR